MIIKVVSSILFVFFLSYAITLASLLNPRFDDVYVKWLCFEMYYVGFYVDKAYRIRD